MSTAGLAPVDLAADAGVRLLALPTPFSVGRINAYLIEDDPLTLIDAGPNSAATLDALDTELASLGHRIEDLGLIVITHQHMDHFGLVDVLARRSGAEVAALDVLAPWLESFPDSVDADDAYAEAIMAAHGVPADTRSVLRAVAAVFHGWGAPCAVSSPLRDGEQLTLRDRSLTIHHRPGHSPSDTVLLDEQRRMLFAGDHLLGHISSNPVITRPLSGPEQPRPRALLTYIESMRRTRDMRLDLVLPGHGEPIPDHRELIDRRLAMHDRRAERIGELIAERTRSAYDIAHELWGNVAVTQAFLTISEVLGHVDLLLRDGTVREVQADDDVTRFEAVVRTARPCL
jgi:glyoxylase-like metal-dependent hydrolase (beta-lactamase superfamily II)